MEKRAHALLYCIIPKPYTKHIMIIALVNPTANSLEAGLAQAC
jgi:hypothetical protein